MNIIGIHIWTWAGILLVACGTILTIYGQSRNSKYDNDELKNTICEKNNEIDELIEGKDALISGNERLISQNILLLGGNEELNSKLDDYQRKIIQKDYQIKELEKQVQQAKFGVSQRYSYDGVITPSGADGVLKIAGDGPSIFRKLAELEKKDTQDGYQEIVEICNDQIKKKPDWFTLYLFRGKAFANLGENTKAIKDLTYVIENGPTSPQYQEPANQLLKEIGK